MMSESEKKEMLFLDLEREKGEVKKGVGN